MQAPPHDDGSRWLLAAALPLFAGGVAWLVKHLLGREAQVVQLGLQRAQIEEHTATTEEIRARTRREDEQAVVAALRLGMQELRADIERLRADRDEAMRHAGAAEVAREEAKRQVELYELQMNKVRAFLKDNNLEFPS